MIRFGVFLVNLLALTIVLASTTSAQTGNTPSLKIVTPSEGQTIYGDKIPVLTSVENLELTDYQKNPTATSGQGHTHLWLDDTNPTAESAVKTFEDTFTYADVGYGDHTLKAELVGNNHKSLIPPQVVTVKFKSAAITAPSPPPTTGFDKNTALVILVVVSLVIIAAWWYTKEEDEEMVKKSLSKPRQKSKARRK